MTFYPNHSERPENASSSSIGREDTASFENGVPTCNEDQPMHEEGMEEDHLIEMGDQSAIVHDHHPLLLAPSLIGAANGAHSTGGGVATAMEMEIASQRLLIQQQVARESDQNGVDEGGAGRVCLLFGKCMRHVRKG